MINQNVVTLDGSVKRAENITDLEIMGLMYATLRTTFLPYETEKSLKQLLFEYEGASIIEQKSIITNFYNQRGYKLVSITQTNSEDIVVVVKLNNSDGTTTITI